MDTDKIDDAVLALLYLGRHGHEARGDIRAWKTFDWEATRRLHEKGMISNPISKAKSVAFTEEGLKRAQILFEQLFGKEDN